MNGITKVFIIINLLLALGAAYTVINWFAFNEHYRRRWQKDCTELANQLKDRDRDILRQSFRATVAESSVNTANARIAELDRTVKDATSRNNELSQELTQKDLQLDKKDKTIDAQSQRITTLERSLEQTRQRQNELNQIAAVARQVAFQLNIKLAEVEDDYNNAQMELTRREETIVRMEKEMRTKDATIALVRTRHPDVYKEVTSGDPGPATLIHAVVATFSTDVNGRQDLVMLTVGKEEQVKEGMEFVIYRGKSFIVKVRATKVMGDMVACQVVHESWNRDGEKIRKGDSAQNRILF